MNKTPEQWQAELDAAIDAVRDAAINAYREFATLAEWLDASDLPDVVKLRLALHGEARMNALEREIEELVK
jgi:hypothetical protein